MLVDGIDKTKLVRSLVQRFFVMEQHHHAGAQSNNPKSGVNYEPYGSTPAMSLEAIAQQGDSKGGRG